MRSKRDIYQLHQIVIAKFFKRSKISNEVVCVIRKIIKDAK
jgi:hypothetical protein